MLASYDETQYIPAICKDRWMPHVLAQQFLEQSQNDDIFVHTGRGNVFSSVKECRTDAQARALLLSDTRVFRISGQCLCTFLHDFTLSEKFVRSRSGIHMIMPGFENNGLLDPIKLTQWDLNRPHGTVPKYIGCPSWQDDAAALQRILDHDNVTSLFYGPMRIKSSKSQ